MSLISKKKFNIAPLASWSWMIVAGSMEWNMYNERRKNELARCCARFLSANIAFIESAKNYNYNATGPSDKYSLLLLLLHFIHSLTRDSPTLNSPHSAISTSDGNSKRDEKKNAAANREQQQWKHNFSIIIVVLYQIRPLWQMCNNLQKRGLNI